MRPGIASSYQSHQDKLTMLGETEEARAQQLSNVWSQKKPKHYGICNELDLLLELEAAPLQQLGTIMGKCGEEQSTAAWGGWELVRTQAGSFSFPHSHSAEKQSPDEHLDFSVQQ